jgi:protoporphyrinogen oxidase
MATGNKRVVVIGSGPCGLGAAWRLKELGHENYVVLEASSGPGGLSVTETDENGFLWDMGESNRDITHP